MTKKRLDLYLVETGQFGSRAQAREAIQAGNVKVDGKAISKPSFPVTEQAQVSAEPLHPYVSRAALKLKGALETFDVRVGDKACLDIGASTGGFVEVLLEAGASKVVAVDVGTGQLHTKVTADPRVVSLEQQDARALSAGLISDAPEIITCDASFIGLAKVIEMPLTLAADQCDLIALFKPQFEVGPAHVGKGGIVKNNAATRAALEAFQAWVDEQTAFQIIAVQESPITGGDGNQEFLIHARKG